MTTERFWTYYDANGPHAFPGFSGTQNNGCTGQNTSFNLTNDQATDGSGYTLTADGLAFVSLFSPQGVSFNPPIGSTSSSSTDANGNMITSTAAGVFTDTLGTTALTLAGTPTMTYSYTNPQGTQSSYTVKYTSYTVQTNFGCTGITEFGPTTESLISEIDLPDEASVPSDKYTFTYEATPGNAGNITGRLASITFPTGGTISYSYSGGSNGITCGDGSTATLTRITPDGTWKYAHSESGTAWTTTVTDPQANQTVYDFQGIYQTERKVNQGSSSLLEDDVTCYNTNTTNCNTTAITLPITKQVVTKTLGNQVCEHVYSYNSFGLLTEQDDYDYGNGAPGSLLRKTLITYASLGNGIASDPSQITVENGGGTTLAETTITYDGTSVVAPPGTTPQHVAITGSRGNATSISSTTGSTNLTKSFTYFDTGNIQTATDVNGSQSTYSYPNATSTCGNAFPTSVSEPLSLSKSMTWNCTGGVETSMTDENGNTVSTAYSDANFWRPASATDQEGNQTNFIYGPNATQSAHFMGSQMPFNSGNSITYNIQYEDPLGRTYVNQQLENPGGSTLDSVSYTYDSDGRLASTSGPCAISWAGTCTGPTTTQTYDGLNRPLVTTDGGGGTVTLSYSANDVLQTIGPAPTGENTKKRQSEYNSIGQLTSVCEATSLTGSGTCGQTTSATGYWTKYTYDALGDLLTVTQNAQSSTTQSRTYTYDKLGRMLSETNPETGAISYVYDTDSTCGTSDGDLVKRTDAAGNVTCYAYDALHRVTSTTYPSGPNSANTASKFFVYDSATVNSVVMANAKTRMAEAYTCTSPCSSKTTDEGFTYTARGEVSDIYESTPHSGGYYHVDQTYWANGALNTISGLTGLTTITYGADGEGRASTVSAGTGQNPVSATSYNVASQPMQVTFGSGDNDAYQYDANTFRMKQYQFNINGQSDTGVLTWNANWSLGKLAIIDAFNSADTQTCTYSHDDLARILSANCGSVFSDTYSYDAFGNLTKNGTFQFQPGYNQNNQMSSGASYDTNGDVLSDGLHSYAWDSNGRPTTIDGIGITYDALGRMAERNNSGSFSQIVWSPTSVSLAYMNGQTFSKAYVPLPAGGVAIYTSSGLFGYHHMDWLGSYRLESNTGRSEVFDTAYDPFGEPYATSGSAVPGFTGMTEDTTSNLYDFLYREYGVQGRWPSPDPAGTAAANPANPQSWNRYAYALNNPLNTTDPSGLRPNAPEPNDPLGDYPGCYMDGIPIGCGQAEMEESTGGGMPCPDSSCGGVGNPYICDASGNCNYTNNLGLIGGFYAPNGVFISIVQTLDGIEYVDGYLNDPVDVYCNGREFNMPNYCGDGGQFLAFPGGPGNQPYLPQNQFLKWSNRNPRPVPTEPPVEAPYEPPPDLQNPFWKLFDEILQDVLGPPPKLTFPFIIPNPCSPNLRGQFPGLCGGPMA